MSTVTTLPPHNLTSPVYSFNSTDVSPATPHLAAKVSLFTMAANSSHSPCAAPHSYVAETTLAGLWHVVYWTCQALTWFVLWHNILRDIFNLLNTYLRRYWHKKEKLLLSVELTSSFLGETGWPVPQLSSLLFSFSVKEYFTCMCGSTICCVEANAKGQMHFLLFMDRSEYCVIGAIQAIKWAVC